MKYGLLEELYEIGAYILGKSKMPWIPYNESGDWEQYLPKYEPQAEDFETNGCTIWGTQNQIETFEKLLTGIEPNYAERFNYLLAPVDPARGADPQKAYESVRRDGLISNRSLSFPDTLAEFLDITDIKGRHYVEGQRWLNTYDFEHEWLWTTRPKNALDIMKQALKTSPLGVSVTAWHKENGVFVDRGLRNNHWCIVYRIDEQGIHAFDSYDHSKKILSLDHNISRVKRIWLNKKTRTASRRHVSILTRILQTLMSKPTLVSIATAHLNTDVTPQDNVPDDVACAEVVTTLLKKLKPETPIITGTWTFWEYLKNNATQIDAAEPGAIIISPTGTGTKGTIGHVGICMDDGTIASNNSFEPHKGKFIKNFTVSTWNQRYAIRQNMPVYYFKVV